MSLLLDIDPLSGAASEVDYDIQTREMRFTKRQNVDALLDRNVASYNDGARGRQRLLACGERRSRHADGLADRVQRASGAGQPPSKPVPAGRRVVKVHGRQAELERLPQVQNRAGADMSVLSDTEKLLLEAQQSCERGDIHRMLVAADELLRREPDNVDAMFIAGTAFLKAEQYGMAALTLNAARCATKDPVKLGPIWNNIGCALQEYQPHESYRAFRKSLDYGTPPPATYDNLCNVASTIGRHAEAMD
jgi:predicted Zn-dependent protease